MSTGASRTGLCLTLVLATVASVSAAPWPNPPRNGAHSVQAIFGGRDLIPMCIVPPRTFESGAAIPNGTPCTIVVYRSRDEGKPGTYTEEVGRGTGPVEREWIDVGAKVPPEGANGGVIYLASCAIVNGEMSDLNNQYLTIVWAPGSFNVKEYPAAGSKPGAPPGRKARPGPETYPAWLTGLGALARGGVPATGGAAYTLQTPPLTELNPEFDTDIRLKISLKADATGALSGSTDLEPWLADIRKDNLVQKTEVQRNEVTGTLISGALKGVIEIRIVIHAQQGNEKAVGTMSATTSLTGTANAAGEIPGQANTQMSLVVTGFAPSSRQKPWTFTATRTAGGSRMVLLAPDSMGNAMAAPGRGFETQASKAGGGIIGEEFQKSIVGTIELDVGGSMLFTLDGRRPNMKLDSKLGRMVSVNATPRMLPQAPQWYAGPGGVLESTPVGNGVQVRAVGEGMGEVWARSLWEIPTPDGGTETGAMVNIWVVPVGAEARGRVNQSRGGATTTQDGGFPGERIGKVIISGRAVRAGMGVPGAQVALWRDPEGVYYKPDWVTGTDGAFRLTCDGSLPGGGLIPGRYEVMVQWHAGNTDTAAILRDKTKTFVDDDLWPRKRHMITINKETAASGEITVIPIQLTRIADMDWSQRE